MELNVNFIKLNPDLAALVGPALDRLRQDPAFQASLGSAGDGVISAMNAVIEACAAITATRSLAGEGLTLFLLDVLLDRLIAAVCRTMEARISMLTLDGALPITEDEQQQISQTEAALAQLTPEGRGFLKRPFSEQYHHVSAFLVAAERHRPILNTLGLSPTVDRVAVLNAHYGAAQKLAPPPTTPLSVNLKTDPMAPVLAAFERALRRYLIELLHRYHEPNDPALAQFHEPVLRQIETQRQRNRAS